MDLSDITTRNPETTLPSSPIIVEQLVLDIEVDKPTGHLLQPVAAAPAEHLLTPIAPPSRKYFCSPCNETIHTFPELVMHFLVAPAHASHLDRAEAQGFRCQTCHKAFSLPQDFEVHLRREKKHMRWQKATGRSTPATMGTDASSLESFQERPSSQRHTVTPVPLVERKTIMSPPLTPSPSHRGKSHSRHVSFHARVLDVDAYPTTPSAKSVVNTQRFAFTTLSTPGSGYSNGSDQVDVVDNDLEDCITYCRQCCTEFPCVEALIDHYHNDSTHRGDDIWCYTCDQAFGKAHILWPHLLRSVRHDNAPSGSRFEFSSAGYRMEGLLSGLRSSGEAPLEIDYANLKIYKSRRKEPGWLVREILEIVSREMEKD
ncbi:hypothetical protein QFC24_002235 [Naganishia onofrii]|uniref:Uncharacterized protein n=1 Tax=Naganishia onofrii TaxID=1851511 RepID=A0ACC2XTD2_9TREE|nr:hypothetical protein QFC24_002235 [Naganishia onofrii]